MSTLTPADIDQVYQTIKVALVEKDAILKESAQEEDWFETGVTITPGCPLDGDDIEDLIGVALREEFEFICEFERMPPIEQPVSWSALAKRMFDQDLSFHSSKGEVSYRGSVIAEIYLVLQGDELSDEDSKLYLQISTP